MGGAGLLHWILEVNADEPWEEAKLRAVLEKMTGEELEKLMKAKDGAGSTPIHWACNSGNVQGLQVIFEKATKDLSREVLRQVLEIEDEVGEQAIHYASLSGHLPCLSLLLDHGSLVDSISASGNSPLHYAAMNRHYDAIALLINHVCFFLFFLFLFLFWC